MNNTKLCRQIKLLQSFPAENLLRQGPGKKWKTKFTGEKTAYCILELQKPVRITGIDIGNEHSAFVEVLVSCTGCRVEDFKEILITCSFMTPFESKNSSNTNRVRCFNQEALVSSVIEDKWNFLKIVCSQPFNKNCQYGLSFIKIHIAESKLSEPINASAGVVPEKTHQRKTLATFALREESPDSESESTAALFCRWKKSRNESDVRLPTPAAAIRQASTNADLIKLSKNYRQTNTSKIKETNNTVEHFKSLDRNRNDIAFESDEDADNQKLRRLSKEIEVEKQRLKAEKKEILTTVTTQIENNKKHLHNRKEELSKKTQDKTENSVEKKKTQPHDIKETPGSTRKRRSSPNNRISKTPTVADSLRYRPFNKLFEGVVLVISGIQNPDRADLRGKALAMGAKYKTDWELGCTHLICAFKNTPKYNQVKGLGKIVKRSWIEKSFSLKKYLPWRRFALDNNEQSEPESDFEILDETLKPNDDMLSYSGNGGRCKKESISLKNVSQSKSFHIDSGSDTDDYIEDIKKKTHQNDVEMSTGERDIYEVTTEEEEFVKEKSTKASLSLQD